MKRVFAIALTLLLVVALTCTAAFADGSKSDAVDVTVNGHPATGIGESNIPMTADQAATAAGLPNGSAQDMRVVWVKDVRQTPPADLSWNIPGADSIYVYQYNGSQWVLIAQAPGGGITATINSKGPVAVAVRLAKSAPTSPKTGADFGMYAAFALAAVAAAAAVSATRKEH